MITMMDNSVAEETTLAAKLLLVKFTIMQQDKNTRMLVIKKGTRTKSTEATPRCSSTREQKQSKKNDEKRGN